MANKPLQSIKFPGLSDTYTTPQVDATLTTTGAAADARKVGDEITSVKQDLNQLDERVTDLETSPVISSDLKAALLQLASKVAYIDDDGQTYYDDLYYALNPPAVLVSISAVYTQIEPIYPNDSLDRLKHDLVVTGHYSDQTTATITEYTLIGTLAQGTSTITVSYDGKTTTFSVTVSQGALYPMENGTHTFTTNGRILTVTEGRHIRYVAPNATSSEVPKGAYLNLSTVSENDTSAEDVSNINLTDTIFTIPAGAEVVFQIKNIHYTDLTGGSSKYAIGVRSGSAGAGLSSGDVIGSDDDITITNTFTGSKNITCITAYMRSPISEFEADLALTVNGEKWI